MVLYGFFVVHYESEYSYCNNKLMLVKRHDFSKYNRTQLRHILYYKGKLTLINCDALGKYDEVLLRHYINVSSCIEYILYEPVYGSNRFVYHIYMPGNELG